MTLGGELVSLSVALIQEAGVVLGVGALTITLVGHLLGIHSRVPETMRGYMRAAYQLRALALVIIIISGGAAILFHIQEGTTGVLLAPAFIFKWLLIAVLCAFYLMERGAAGYGQDAVEGLEGANWYALFIVHTMAPVVSWLLLVGIYIGWIAAFGIVWAAFVWVMRRQAGEPVQ